jgi:hypothetical protein
MLKGMNKMLRIGNVLFSRNRDVNRWPNTRYLDQLHGSPSGCLTTAQAHILIVLKTNPSLSNVQLTQQSLPKSKENKTANFLFAHRNRFFHQNEGILKTPVYSAVFRFVIYFSLPRA